MNGPPQNLDAEESVLGAAMVSESVIAQALSTGLREEHFYRDRHRVIFAAIMRLHDAAEPVDVLTVSAALENAGELVGAGGRDAVASLAAKVPAPGSAKHYAELVVHDAELRHIDEAAKKISQSIAERDEVSLEEARALLDQPITRTGRDLDPQALADLAFELADSGGKEAFPWPFDRLNQLARGGFRRGQFVVVSGHTHFGKTAFSDQIADHAARAGARAWKYVNEMDPEEHLAGMLQRHAGVPFERFIQGKLTDHDRRNMLAAINRGDLRYGLTPIAGWRARDVAAHIRLHRPDVAVVDILHRFPEARTRNESDIAGAVETFAEVAKLADCALVLVAHVNRNRITDGIRPRPTRGDLRGSGSIENDADVVCFVHREQDEETYEPLPEGQIYFDKYRGGKLGGLDVRFDDDSISFRPIDKRWDGKGPDEVAFPSLHG